MASMDKMKSRVFRIDDDEVIVPKVYDEEIKGFVYEYPDFSKKPRYTKKGRMWVNVIDSSCPYTDEKYGDCGSCEFFKCEKSGDLIGICTNEKLLFTKKAKG